MTVRPEWFESGWGEVVVLEGPVISNPSRPGELVNYLLGDLGPARRLLARIRRHEIPLTLASQVVEEIARSVERCAERIETEVRKLELEKMTRPDRGL